MRDENVKLKPNFTQVVIWPGVTLAGESPQAFEDFILNNFDVRVQYLESIITGPTKDELGVPLPNSGGRVDIFFAVHDDDVGKFALPKLVIEAKWIEDVFMNGYGYFYPARVEKYKSWEPDEEVSSFVNFLKNYIG